MKPGAQPAKTAHRASGGVYMTRYRVDVFLTALAWAAVVAIGLWAVAEWVSK